MSPQLVFVELGGFHSLPFLIQVLTASKLTVRKGARSATAVSCVAVSSEGSRLHHFSVPMSFGSRADEWLLALDFVVVFPCFCLPVPDWWSGLFLYVFL